ncbi:hypothetical protein N9C96_01560 [bacterium]|nr:hypothetical protein [bacterium]
MRTLLLVLLTSFSFPAYAQSSLGITGAAFSLGVIEDESGKARGDASGSVSVAITEYHGFQGDLRFSDTASGTIGTIATHLYMTPIPGQKYGLFAALSDVDGRSMLYGSIGAEAMLSLGESTAIEARGGLGLADQDGLDYIFGGLSVAQSLTPAIELEVSLDVADFDETSFSATSYDAGLTANFSPEGSPWGAYASITHSGLIGANSASGETRLGLGLTLTLGTSGGTDPHTRPFRTPDPVAPLVRRGLW